MHSIEGLAIEMANRHRKETPIHRYLKYCSGKIDFALIIGGE